MSDETKAYSIRNMPILLRDRINDQARKETREARAKGQRIVTNEALILRLIYEGLDKLDGGKA